MDEVNKSAFQGTLIAHTDGEVPNLVIELDEMNEFTYGEMVYFFEKACGISGHLLGVNPFDQPGVEAYKKNMFALLVKPGYEAEKAAILERLSKCSSQFAGYTIKAKQYKWFFLVRTLFFICLKKNTLDQ